MLLVGGICPNDKLFTVCPILSICPLQPTKLFNSEVSASPAPNIILQKPLSVNSLINLRGAFNHLPTDIPSLSDIVLSSIT